jgi:hypothetical protein
MKKRKPELDVDFIGGQAPLTEAELRTISEYLKSKKAKKTRLRKRSSASKTKKIA